MNDKTHPSDLDKEREHEGDPAVSGTGKAPAGGVAPKAGGSKTGTASGHAADGSHSRHDERDAGRSA